MGRLVGSARVSMFDQDVRWPWETLRQAGCQEEPSFCDTASDAHTARPGLEACLQALAPGDTLVVWRLDRLGCSMAHLAWHGTIPSHALQRPF
jgi:DNA invertase Pin-like site-specific DNA recombinase